MPQINQELLEKGFSYATLCFAAGLDASPITTWLTQQGKLMTETGSTAASALDNPLGAGFTFDDAVLAAIQSSPKGVGIDDLGPILRHYNRPNNQIGAALSRLSKAQKIVKSTDGLWHLRKAKTAGGVDRTMGQRRRQKNTATGRAGSTDGGTSGGIDDEVRQQAAIG